MNKYQETVWSDVQELMPDYIYWEKITNKNVLITGGYGLIASYIVYMLLCRNSKYGQNIQVYAMMRNEEKAKEHYSDIWHRDDFHPIIQDVCDEITVPVKFDYIIHAASVTNKIGFAHKPIDTIRVNTVGTENLLKIAYKYNSKFFYMSSGKIYAPNLSKQKISEDHDLNNIPFNKSNNAYIDAKKAGELLCFAYKQQLDVEVKIGRFFFIEGISGSLYEKNTCFWDFIESINENRKIIVKGNGNPIRSYLYVADAINAILLILLTGKDIVYNIGSEDNILSIKQLAMLASEYLSEDVKPISILNEDISNNQLDAVESYYVPNMNKLKTLGWRERYTTKNIIERILNYSC